VTSNNSIEKIAGERPNVIINCAAYTNVDAAESDQSSAESVNIFGAKNMAIAAIKCEARLIHISTDYVFSGSGNAPWRPSDLPNPKNIYGRTKYLGEKEVESLNRSNSTVIRTAWLYSPFGSNFAKTIVRKLLSDKAEIAVVADQFGQPTSSLELAKAIYKVCLSEQNYQLLHIANSGIASWSQFAQELARLCNEPPERILPVSSSEYVTQAERPKFSELEVSNYGPDIDLSLPDWRDSLKIVFPEIRRAVEETR
jgi:dTDP-4-dehydrorhamnose reductase